MKSRFIPIVIALALFVLPLFWLPAGFMDLGGDSSRLYFYAPMEYLRHYSLYAISPSGVGAENIGFMTVPIVGLFALLRQFISATILINVFHGFSVAAAFWFVFASVRELLRSAVAKQKYIQLSSVSAGLLYVLSPISIHGWDKALITHNYVFLNPIMFYVLLRYVLTDRFIYLLYTLIITFVFSPNFSFIAAPVFVAFYPLTILCLAAYKLWILKSRFVWRHVLAAFVLFVFLQSFHVIPQVFSMFTPGSVLYTTVFSEKGKIDRGLGYFSAIMPAIKVSVNLFMQPQMRQISALLLFTAFLPVTVILGFVHSKREEQKFKKLLVVLGLAFLVSIFFASANITHIWVMLYKRLFVLPGFSIFRNFYGQWATSYLFYYVMLFAASLVVSLSAHRRWRSFLIIFLLCLGVNAWPFLNGSYVNPILWQSKNSRIAMDMDPAFLQAVKFIGTLPNDGKVLTLPVTDPGYQIVAGKTSGVYQGPSLISYLAGKQDFAGAQELGRYKQLFLNSARDRDIPTLMHILGVLNIRYIFYDNDERVYENFPAFPYEDVRRYLPGTQREYSSFIESLPVRKLASFSHRYIIYELQQSTVTPRVYAASETVSFPSRVQDISIPLSQSIAKGNSSAFFETNQVASISSSWYPADSESIIPKVIKNPDPPRILYDAFVTTAPNSLLYPVIAEKEVFGQWKRRGRDSTAQIDGSLLLAAKRMLELERWGSDMQISENIASLEDLKKIDRIPGASDIPLWDIAAWRALNSWESVLARYYRNFDESLKLIESSSESDGWKMERKFLLSEYLLQHNRRLITYIQEHTFGKDQKSYLMKITDMIFDDLLSRSAINISYMTLPYRVELPEADREYDVVLDRNSIEKGEQISVAIGDSQYQNVSGNGGRWEKLGVISVSHVNPPKDIRVSLLSSRNLLTPDSKIELETSKFDEGSGTLNIDANYIKGEHGLVWEIGDLQPDSIYFLSFKYKTSGDPFLVRVLDGGSVNGVFNRASVLVEDMLKSTSWRTYQAVVRTNLNVNAGIVQVATGKNQLQLSNIDIQDLRFVHVQRPYIAFVHHTESAASSPHISVKQSSPTSYRVHVEGATNPYILVLQEEVNPDWVIRRVDATGTEGKDRENESFGLRMADVVDHIIFTFRGSKMPFSHYEANGYSNAWYIRPEEVDGASSYDLELYMNTQSYFYLGAIVSSATLFLIFILLVLNNRRFLNPSYLKDWFYYYLLSHYLSQCDTVLDLGCGAASPISNVPKAFYSIGVDIFRPSIAASKSRGIHDEYKQIDLLRLDQEFAPKSVDAVVLLDVVEHFTKSEAHKLLAMAEKVATKYVIVLTPNGFYEQDAYAHNRYQIHKSGWSVRDLARLGYEVRGLRGWKFIRGEYATIYRRPWIFWAIISFISEPLLYFFPRASYHLFGVKYIQ